MVPTPKGSQGQPFKQPWALVSACVARKQNLSAFDANSLFLEAVSSLGKGSSACWEAGKGITGLGVTPAWNEDAEISSANALPVPD